VAARGAGSAPRAALDRGCAKGLHDHCGADPQPCRHVPRHRGSSTRPGRLLGARPPVAPRSGGGDVQVAGRDGARSASRPLRAVRGDRRRRTGCDGRGRCAGDGGAARPRSHRAAGTGPTLRSSDPQARLSDHRRRSPERRASPRRDGDSGTRRQGCQPSAPRRGRGARGSGRHRGAAGREHAAGSWAPAGGTQQVPVCACRHRQPSRRAGELRPHDDRS
jgi:hypothetical protein